MEKKTANHLFREFLQIKTHQGDDKRKHNAYISRVYSYFFQGQLMIDSSTQQMLIAAIKNQSYLISCLITRMIAQTHVHNFLDYYVPNRYIDSCWLLFDFFFLGVDFEEF